MYDLHMCGKIFLALALLLGAGAATWTVAAPAQNRPVGADDKGTQSLSPPENAEVTTEIELQIERVVPMSRFHGEALLAAVDPRFILVGQVYWVQKPGVLALHSQQAFAIHSPTQLGLNGWQKGSRICLLLTRTRTKEQTQWRLSALKPDVGCTGGG